MTVLVNTVPDTVTVVKLHSSDDAEAGVTACATVELLGAGAARTCFKGAE